MVTRLRQTQHTPHCSPVPVDVVGGVDLLAVQNWDQHTQVLGGNGGVSRGRWHLTVVSSPMLILSHQAILQHLQML